jgi:hypothetical protein
VLRRVLAVSVDRRSKKDRRIAEEANLGRFDPKHNKHHTTVLRGQIQIAESGRAFPKKHLNATFSSAQQLYRAKRNRKGCETL